MDKNILAIVMGVIAIAIAFVIFPIVLDGAATILADVNLADYTGLEAIVQVAPLIVFVAMLFGGGLLAFKGASGYRKSKSKR